MTINRIKIYSTQQVLLLTLLSCQNNLACSLKTSTTYKTLKKANFDDNFFISKNINKGLIYSREFSIIH